jgi:hypothetical protein
VALSIAETQARIDGRLNPPGQPFRYYCQGDQVVGTWDIADVSYADLLGGGTIDKAYAITVTLDERAGSYAYSERRTDSHTSFGTEPDGSVGFSGSRQAFKGRSVSKEWGGGFTLGRATSHGQQGSSWSYSFESARIKQPLLDLLHDAGWEPARKGLMARLFER